MAFGFNENSIIEALTKRASKLMELPIENLEPVQVTCYRPGEFYLHHQDFFDPQDPGSVPHLARGGQRVKTLIAYLQAPEAGGCTSFPSAGGLEVDPIAGSAIVFGYPTASGADLSLHGGDAVTAGEKMIATWWGREGAFR